MIDIRLGDCLSVLKGMEDGTVQCVVTSPPYFGLRDYGVDGQIGLEATPEAYVANLVSVFREVRRVLRDDGTVWLNLGDSYWGGKGASSQAWSGEHLERDTLQKSYHQISGKGETRPTDGKHETLKPKDLIGIPWRVAFALQADGWYLRSDIIWHKPNPMPESVTDRPTKSHEYMFLLSKSSSYFYDAEAIKEPAADRPVDSWEKRKEAGAGSGSMENGHNSSLAKGAGFSHTVGNGVTRNRRTVWTIATKPYKGAHFATYPPALVEPCIKAGTSERGKCPICGAPWERVTEKPDMSQRPTRASDSKMETEKVHISNGWGGYPKSAGQKCQEWRNANPDVTTGWQPTCEHDADPVPCIVLDPFSGSGTTGAVAVKLGRDYIGIELNPAYIELSEQRIGKVQLVMA